MRLSISAFFVVVILLSLCACDGAAPYPPGVLAPEDPFQEDLAATRVFVKGAFTVRPLAQFRLVARVLSRKRYRFGRDATLSPVDLALGWGRMSDQAVLDHVKITQSRRFYYWRVKQYPIPRREIIEHSANMHMIPATDEVKAELLAVEEGDLIEVEGYLVVATTEDGWHWKSSTTRKDAGDGACELVWVERITRL